MGLNPFECRPSTPVNRRKDHEIMTEDAVSAAADVPGIAVMNRKGDFLVRGVVDRMMLFATFPAGTPIARKPGKSYHGSLSWLEAEGLLENDGAGGLRLSAPVKFINPGAALVMIMGTGNKPWTGEDDHPVDFRHYGAVMKQKFVTTGVKVRRA